MPDRLLRPGILTSDAVNRCSWAAEVFYRRLMSVVDDFGRYDGRPSVLRAALYALKIDRVSEPDIGKWIRETEEAGLVRRYTVDGKPYIELLKFDQKVRALKSKWPDPPARADKCTQMSADASAVAFAVGDVVAFDKNPLSGSPPDGTVSKKKKINGAAYYAEAEDVLNYLNEQAKKSFEFRNPNGELTANAEVIIQRLKQGYTRVQLREVIRAKCDEWLGKQDMHTYLRPETLFGRKKFEQYVGDLNAS